MGASRVLRYRSRRWIAGQAVLTVIGIGVVAAVGIPLARWVLYGADWGVVAANQRLFSVGAYAGAAMWRIGLCLVGIAGLTGISTVSGGAAILSAARMLAIGLAALVAAPIVAVAVRSDAAGVVLMSGPVVRVFGPVPQSSLFDIALAIRPAATVLVVALAALAAGRLWAVRSVGRVGPAAETDPETARLQRRFQRRLRWAWLLLPLACIILLRGVLPTGPLVVVGPSNWGGLLLTMVLSVGALLAAFPLGVLLALGRRSSLPLVRALSVLYIEVVRGVPLVTILFMSQVMLPLVLPPGPWLDRVFRAMVGFALFTAAYLAEDVRGGLAAVGRGQMEAARAVGLGSAGAYRLVVLPQALRVVVPSLVGQFIALFKDTSLAQIVGLNELLGIAVAVVAQPLWRGRAPESLVFAAAVYFVFSYAMARISRDLESRERMAT